MDNTHSDALVFFGATGDLAYKQIFPALQSMVKQGKLAVPVIGVAKAGWNLDQLKERAKDSLEKHGGVDEEAWGKLQGLLKYVDGDYADAATFTAVREALGGAKNPAHYLAIPPSLFGKVVEQLVASGCSSGARMIVEKPFGHDLESAKELNRILHSAFDESAIFRIDHYLAKGSVLNMVSFRFSNSIIEALWNRDHVESVQITMAESFGVQGRGSFYDATGATRDVLQNHVFQVLCNLVMDAPSRNDAESIRDEKARVLKAIPPIETGDFVRGQFHGYLDERGVAPDSKTETFAAMKLKINSWRWEGVPFYLRAGKNLPVTALEILARFRKPPVTNFSPVQKIQNHIRFRLSPEIGVGISLSAAPREKDGDRTPIELIASRHPQPGEMDAYVRVLGDAMKGDATLFARQDCVEEAWRIVDPVLKANTPVYGYDQGTWGPKEVDARVKPEGGWHAPMGEEPDDYHVLSPEDC